MTLAEVIAYYQDFDPPVPPDSKPGRPGVILQAGFRSGQLMVIGLGGRAAYGHRLYICICDCGKTTATPHQNLVRGMSRSCRCTRLKSRSRRASVTGNNIHLVHAFNRMHVRCGRDSHYAGVSIDPGWNWENGFPAFREWALANGYQSDLTLDRIDGTKGYGPINCRWANVTEQSRNRRGGLTQEIVTEARMRFADGESRAGICDALGVTRRVLAHIVGWWSWKEIGTEYQAACLARRAKGRW